MTKENSEASVINLGLSSLVDDGAPAQKPLCDPPGVIASFDWIDLQRKRGALPKALIIERSIAVIGALRPELRTETLQERIDLLIAALTDSDSSSVSAELIHKLRAANQGTSISNAVEVDTAKPVADSNSPVSERVLRPERQPEWSRFAELVTSVQHERVSPATEGRPPDPRPPHRRFGSRSLRVIIVTFALFGLIYLAGSFFSREAGEEWSEKARFARVRSVVALAPTTVDDLLIPRFEPLSQVGSLSSLAYEISTRANSKAPETAARVMPVSQAEIAIAPSSPPQPRIPQREALNIGPSNEPAALREIQVEPEAAEPESTFDFPPFVHKSRSKAEPASESTRSGGLYSRSVERFSPPRRYSITAATQVMSRPSYWAPRIGDYDPGDQILVDARMGNWVRVVREYGASAYILAQDAVPE